MASTDGDGEEIYFHNPTYDEGTSMTRAQLPVPSQNGSEASSQLLQESYPTVTYRMYDAVNIPSQTATQDGQTYDLLHRGKVNGQYLSYNMHGRLK